MAPGTGRKWTCAIYKSDSWNGCWKRCAGARPESSGTQGNRQTGRSRTGKTHTLPVTIEALDQKLWRIRVLVNARGGAGETNTALKTSIGTTGRRSRWTQTVWANRDGIRRHGADGTLTGMRCRDIFRLSGTSWLLLYGRYSCRSSTSLGPRGRGARGRLLSKTHAEAFAFVLP